MTEVSGADTFTLQPNDTSKPEITAKVSGSDTLTGLTANTGTNIVWDNGSQTAAPGTAITPPAPPPASGSATITVTNEQLYGYNYDSEEYTPSTKSGKVYVEYWYWDNEIGEYKAFGEVEIGTVTNGKLSFKLQATPPAAALFEVIEVFSSSLTLSDESAKGCGAALYFTDGSGEYYLEYNNNVDYEDEVWAETAIYYLDRNVNITGSYNDDYYYNKVIHVSVNNFNVSFKKGWNIVYVEGIYTEENVTYNYSATKPATASNLKWNIWNR